MGTNGNSEAFLDEGSSVMAVVESQLNGGCLSSELKFKSICVRCVVHSGLLM